jgi:hypothetical protein
VNQGARCSITGGFVYRGAAQPSMQGLYVFADFCSGEILALDRSFEERRLYHQENAAWDTFGEGLDGELYVADFATGTIYRLVYR